MLCMVGMDMDMELHTQGCTYSFREVCVGFRMDLTHRGGHIHGEKLVLGLGLQ